MSGVHVYSSFTYSYLSRARVLVESIRRRHPTWVVWAVMIDEPPPGFDDVTWRREFDHVISQDTLFPEVWRWWLFKHDIVEACTAVKGQAMVHILASGAPKVIYLDPDIALFNGLEEIESRLDTSSIVLTPHQVEPNSTEAEIADNEITSMKYGIYNLGFLAVKNDLEGNKMAEWWAKCLFRSCYDDVPNGIFTDQKYCDHVPGLFGNVFVERDPGYNVASWNLSSRTVTVNDAGYIAANSSPLRFYHFTKINSEGDVMTERYADGRIEIFEVWNWYKRAIKGKSLPGIPAKYWHYGTFSDGTLITKAARLVYRQNDVLMARFRNPFAAGEGSFQSWLTAERPDCLIK